MPTSQITISGDVGGAPMNTNISRTADGQISHEVQVPAAKTGTLTTRTTDTTGTLTMQTGHGFVQNDKIDLYWTGGRRYNVVVGTVAGDSVPISGGSGDILPAQGTAVTAMKQVTIDTDFDGAKLEIIGANCAARGRIGFFEATVEEVSVDLAANEAWLWWKGGSGANPLASTVVSSMGVTQAGTTTATFKLGLLYDSTP